MEDFPENPRSVCAIDCETFNAFDFGRRDQSVFGIRSVNIVSRIAMIHLGFGFVLIVVHTVGCYMPADTYNGIYNNNGECPRRVGNCVQYAKYRNYDGSCTNPFKPAWDIAGSNYIYLLGPEYNDGVQSPKVQVRNAPLPSSRSVKNTFFPDGNEPSDKNTLLTMSWGQFLAHDLAMLRSRNAQRIPCCGHRGQSPIRPGSSCFPISIPRDDPVMSFSGITCMNVTRIESDLSTGCRRDGTAYPALPLNEVTPAVDLSLVYGISYEESLDLRTRNKGQFKTEFRNNFVYPQTVRGESGCSVNYLFGDSRANQNTPLTLIHIAFVNYHNIIALKLSSINPRWDDDKIFEETRRLMIALHQYFSYYEWLPIIMGKENLLKAGIVFKTHEYVDDFNPFINLAISTEFSHAAMRILHTLIPDYFGLYSRNRLLVSQIKLSDNFLCQQILEVQGAAEQLAIGLVTQPMKKYDNLHAESITEGLFKNPGNNFGVDLRSLDIQRGRDVGLRSYVDYLKMCRFVDSDANPSDWSIFNRVLKGNAIDRLRRIYATPDSVDLSTGLGLEPKIDGTQLSPTSICIFVDQMLRLRRGDQRWFEHSQAGFTPAQLKEIKSASLAKMLCDSLWLEEIQPHPFYQPFFSQNQLQPCSNYRGIDLTPWIDIK